MRRIALFAALGTICGLCLSAGPAFAFSDEPAPSGPAAQSQFSDPDAAVDNFANPAVAQGATGLSVDTQVPSGKPVVEAIPANPADAEPVNPAWPLWMQWHQQ